MSDPLTWPHVTLFGLILGAVVLIMLRSLR